MQGFNTSTPDGRVWRIDCEVDDSGHGFRLFEISMRSRRAIRVSGEVAGFDCNDLEEEHDCPEDDLWPIGDLLDYLEAVGATRTEDLVDKADACPNCGERHTDTLEWMNDEDNQVACGACKFIFSPGQRSAEAPPLPTAVSAEGAD